MRLIFGRFIDCLILWLLSLFYVEFGTDHFWRVLSVNTQEGDYGLHIITMIFSDNYVVQGWKLYLDKAWQEFYEEVLNND